MTPDPASSTNVIVRTGECALDAKVALEEGEFAWALVLESRSGSSRSGHARNPDYVQALEYLLIQLGALSATLQDISVVSAPAMRLDPDARRLPLGFPMILGSGDNFHAIRKNVTEAQRQTARTPRTRDSSGGNNNKRIRIQFTLASSFTVAALSNRLSGEELGSTT